MEVEMCSGMEQCKHSPDTGVRNYLSPHSDGIYKYIKCGATIKLKRLYIGIDIATGVIVPAILISPFFDWLGKFRVYTIILLPLYVIAKYCIFRKGEYRVVKE
jgi:hypothetical protein